MFGRNLGTGMKQHTITHKLFSRDRRLHCVLGLKSDILECICKERLQKINVVPEAKFWQQQTVSLMTETGKLFMHQLSRRSFEQYTFKNVGKNSGVRDIPVSHCHGEVLFGSLEVFQPKLVWGVSAFRPTKWQSHKTAAFGLSPSFLPGSQRWCHFTRGLSWGACGNRKQGMLQPFPSCQPNTRHDQISDADFAVCPLSGCQFPWGIFNNSRDGCVGYQRLVVSYRIHAKYRLYSKDWPSERVRPKANKAEAEGCQDPRRLFFFFPRNNVNLSCYLLSIPWSIFLSFGSAVCCFCCHNVELSTCTWRCGKIKSSNELQGSITRSARYQKTEAQT